MTNLGRDRKYITRFEFGRSHGWWVRFQRVGPDKVAISKFFSDAVHSGRHKALAAAFTWRDEQLKKLDLRPRKSLERGDGYIRLSTRFFRSRQGKASARYLVWEAWIRLGKKANHNAQTSYSIERWTESGAKDKARKFFLEQRKALGLDPLEPTVRSPSAETEKLLKKLDGSERKRTRKVPPLRVAARDGGAKRSRAKGVLLHSSSSLSSRRPRRAHHRSHPLAR